jgi:2-polyprenyl-3-methyl-5-hydroxy-6-metoxy-1,4-benzoquinol methylase
VKTLATHSIRDYNLESRDTSDHQYHYHFDTILRQFMMRSFQPFMVSGKALEMGCFKGEVTDLLLQHYSDLTVVEASDELIRCAQERLGTAARFVHERFETYETEDRYDALFLIHTLEHLDEPISVLKRASSWLNNQGVFFIAVPNANALSRQIAVKMGLISHNSAVTEAERLHGHRCTYSLDTLERDAREAGLEVIHRGGIFLKPFANFQFDRLMETEIISEGYLEACYQLGMKYPDLSASIFLVCKRSQNP